MASRKLTLHHLTSSRSLTVLMALEEAASLPSSNLDYSVKVYPRLQGTAPPSLLAVHPRGKSPVLVIETSSSETGSFETEVLTQTPLLLQYIASNYTNGELSPQTPAEQQRAIFFTQVLSSDLWDRVMGVLLYDVLPQFAPWGFQSAVRLLISPVISFHLQSLRKLFEYLEDQLSDEQPWFSGEKSGFTDLYGVFAMDTVVQRGFNAWDPAKFPRLERWYRGYTGRESYKRALEKGGAYDLKWFT